MTEQIVKAFLNLKDSLAQLFTFKNAVGKIPNIDEEDQELPFTTCPFDPRFPHTNQTKHCFISFVDYQKCDRLLGTYDGCEQFKKCYLSLCPNFWIEKWEEQIENGTFPVNLPPKD